MRKVGLFSRRLLKYVLTEIVQALQEKLDAINRLEELERALTNTEEELKHQRNMAETSRSELLELAKKHDVIIY